MTETQIEDKHTFQHSMRSVSTSPGSDLDSKPEVPRQRVLIVDDDSDFVDMTKLILCKAGFDVAGALSGPAALEKCNEVNPDLILLDLMMPEVDGFETYQHLKRVTEAPVIVVTATGDRENAARSFQAGMEDYISKPFCNSEMIARIKAALRRSRQRVRENTRSFPEMDLMINFETHEVFLHGRFIWFVPREFTVLSILAQQAPRPVKYATILNAIWGDASSGNRTHLKNIVFRLRQKLEEDPNDPKYLINLRSLGYQLNAQPGEARFSPQISPETNEYPKE